MLSISYPLTAIIYIANLSRKDCHNRHLDIIPSRTHLIAHSPPLSRHLLDHHAAPSQRQQRCDAAGSQWHSLGRSIVQSSREYQAWGHSRLPSFQQHPKRQPHQLGRYHGMEGLPVRHFHRWQQSLESASARGRLELDPRRQRFWSDLPRREVRRSHIQYRHRQRRLPRLECIKCCQVPERRAAGRYVVPPGRVDRV